MFARIYSEIESSKATQLHGQLLRIGFAATGSVCGGVSSRCSLLPEISPSTLLIARGNNCTTAAQVDLGTFGDSNKKSTDKCSTDLPVQIPDGSSDVLMIRQRMAALLVMMLQSLSKT
jgi:hypothetical protein